jgi:hypothetical protein
MVALEEDLLSQLGLPYRVVIAIAAKLQHPHIRYDSGRTPAGQMWFTMPYGRARVFAIAPTVWADAGRRSGARDAGGRRLTTPTSTASSTRHRRRTSFTTQGDSARHSASPARRARRPRSTAQVRGASDRTGCVVEPAPT